MKALVIAATNLRRFARDRSNIFFVFIFPLALVAVIGLQFGDQGDPRVAVTGVRGPVGEAIVRELEANDQIDVRTRGDAQSIRDAVANGEVEAGVLLPDGLEGGSGIGAAPDETFEVQFVSTDAGIGPQLRSIVQDAVARAGASRTAVAVAVDRGAEAGAATDAAAALADRVSIIEVRTVTTGERLFPEDIEGFDIGAPAQLVLFVFLTALTGSAALIQTRRLGVSARMMSTPTSLRTIIAGEALGRFAVAVVQGVYILVGSVVLFGVDWGDLLGAIAVLVLFGAVGAAAAMLAGSVFRSDQQAAGVTVVVALVLAAIGGAMLPIELFSDTLRSIARFTPHYWAVDAFSELVRHDATVLDIGRQLGMLAVYALALGALAAYVMRRTLSRS